MRLRGRCLSCPRSRSPLDSCRHRLSNFVACLLQRGRAEVAEQCARQHAFLVLEPVILISGNVGDFTRTEGISSIGCEMLAAALENEQKLVTARMPMMLVDTTGL